MYMYITEPDRIELDKIFNTIPLPDIKNISDIEDVSKIRPYFRIWEKYAGVAISDHDILSQCQTIQKNNIKVENLKQLPVVEQRSDQWYKMRDQMITASDFGQALGVGKFGSTKDFYIKKCGYQQPQPFYAGAMSHGIRYEPVATRAYEIKMNTTVHEFGLLQHPQFEFLGASPDGITDHGVMLEIKCPFKRKIDGVIVEQYRYQMQGQLDVSKLDVCHFLECKFEEYLDYIDFEDDWDPEKVSSKEGHHKGAIIEFADDTDPIYSDPGVTKDEFTKWFTKTIRNLHDRDFVVIYYRLTEYSLQIVERDDEFLNEKNDLLSKIWENILKYKKNKSCYDEDIGFKPPPKKKPIRCLFRDIE